MNRLLQRSLAVTVTSVCLSAPAFASPIVFTATPQMAATLKSGGGLHNQRELDCHHVDEHPSPLSDQDSVLTGIAFTPDRRDHRAVSACPTRRPSAGSSIARCALVSAWEPSTTTITTRILRVPMSGDVLSSQDPSSGRVVAGSGSWTTCWHREQQCHQGGSIPNSEHNVTCGPVTFHLNFTGTAPTGISATFRSVPAVLASIPATGHPAPGPAPAPARGPASAEWETPQSLSRQACFCWAPAWRWSATASATEIKSGSSWLISPSSSIFNGGTPQGFRRFCF